jgi:hypothetical protein
LQYFKDKYPQYADKVKFENLGLASHPFKSSFFILRFHGY